METKKIEGHAIVSGQVKTGRDVDVKGDVTVGHNVRVEGWLEARNIKGVCKGLFETADDLKKAYGRGKAGWWAMVGVGFPARLWVCGVDGEWHDTGEDVTSDDLKLDLAGVYERIKVQEEVADEALANSEAALANSEAAVSAATEAVALSKEAKRVADDADRTAFEADHKATNAEYNALQAVEKSEAAVDTAERAVATAKNAVATAEEAKAQSDATKEEVGRRLGAMEEELRKPTFAGTMILPFDGVLHAGDAVPGGGVWYVEGDDGRGHFEVVTNMWGYGDGDYNSRTPGGAVYPNPGRVWVRDDGRLFMSSGMRIVAMLTMSDFAFDSESGVLDIMISI